MVRVGMIGFGGIAQAHKAGYEEIVKEGGCARLVAVCDITPERFENKTEINLQLADAEKQVLEYNTYTDLEEMLAKEQLDMIDICIPTYLHRDMAVAMMRRGYHVLCEKPMARTYADCLEMLKVSEETGKKLMIGQCLHFFAEYEYLEDLVKKDTYGKVISGFFHRLSAPPIWGWQNWYMDVNKSGGCIQDLSIHDLDIVKHIFGKPDSVTCHAKDVLTRWDAVHSTLMIGDVPFTVVGDWTLTGFPFSTAYRVAFAKATVEMINGVITVYPVEGEKFSPELVCESGYKREAAYLARLIETGEENTRNKPEAAAETIRLIEALRQSNEQGGEPVAF